MTIPELPKTLERPCCRGKSCGMTTLELQELTAGTADGEAAVPTLYRYVRRSNGNVYGPGWSSASALAEWITESAAEMEADAKRLEEILARAKPEGTEQ